MEKNDILYLRDDGEDEEESKGKCPICGEELVIVGHCKTCYTCGFGTCDL